MVFTSQSPQPKETKTSEACAGELARHEASGTQLCAGESVCPSVDKHSRVLIEFCCGPESKLGDQSRKVSKCCYVIGCTEERDVTVRTNRMDIRDEVMTALAGSASHPCPILVWISIPCTGGTTWSDVNLQHESARLKGEYHRHAFDKIWSSMIVFMNLIRHLNPMIAIVWPAHCAYWKFNRVDKFWENTNL